MSGRPVPAALRHELERKNRLIRLLTDRVDVQARYITTLEHKLAELTFPLIDDAQSISAQRLAVDKTNDNSAAAKAGAR